MISELYTALTAALKNIKDGEGEDAPRLVKHIDLWNQNVAFIEEESPWPRPAVFIEFGRYPGLLLEERASCSPERALSSCTW